MLFSIRRGLLLFSADTSNLSIHSALGGSSHLVGRRSPDLLSPSLVFPASASVLLVKADQCQRLCFSVQNKSGRLASALEQSKPGNRVVVELRLRGCSDGFSLLLIWDGTSSCLQVVSVSGAQKLASCLSQLHAHLIGLGLFPWKLFDGILTAVTVDASWIWGTG